MELDGALSAKLTAYARADAPDEACGLLLGRSVGERAIVERAPRLRNHAADRRRAFLIDPADIVRADAEAAREGLALVGVWHSHPGGEHELSARDRAAAWPGHVQLLIAIAASGTVTCAAWVRRDGHLRPVRLVAAPVGVAPAGARH